MLTLLVENFRKPECVMSQFFPEGHFLLGPVLTRQDMKDKMRMRHFVHLESVCR